MRTIEVNMMVGKKGKTSTTMAANPPLQSNAATWKARKSTGFSVILRICVSFTVSADMTP